MNTSRSNATPSSYATCFESTMSNVTRSPNFLRLLLNAPRLVLKCFILARTQDSQYGFLKRWVSKWTSVFASCFSVPLLARRVSPSTMSTSSWPSSSSKTSRSASTPPGTSDGGGSTPPGTPDGGGIEPGSGSSWSPLVVCTNLGWRCFGSVFLASFLVKFPSSSIGLRRHIIWQNIFRFMTTVLVDANNPFVRWR